MEFARHEFKLSKPGSDGVSLRDKLESVAERSGKRPEGLDSPAMPDQAMHIWAYFREISQGRTAGFGPSPLSWLDLHAWQQIRGIALDDVELRMIRALDTAWIEVFATNGAES